MLINGAEAKNSCTENFFSDLLHYNLEPFFCCNILNSIGSGITYLLFLQTIQVSENIRSHTNIYSPRGYYTVTKEVAIKVSGKS